MPKNILAQRLTNALCISLGKINIYVELDKKIMNIHTLIGNTQYLPYSALLLETDAYATEYMLIRYPYIVSKTGY